jgi:hypothetical protein
MSGDSIGATHFETLVVAAFFSMSRRCTMRFILRSANAQQPSVFSYGYDAGQVIKKSRC